MFLEEGFEAALNTHSRLGTKTDVIFSVTNIPLATLCAEACLEALSNHVTLLVFSHRDLIRKQKLPFNRRWTTHECVYLVALVYPDFCCCDLVSGDLDIQT